MRDPADGPTLLTPAVADALGTCVLPLAAADLVALRASSHRARDLLDQLPPAAWQPAARRSRYPLRVPLPTTVTGWVAASAARARVVKNIRGGTVVARIEAPQGGRLVGPGTATLLACRHRDGWREVDLLTGRRVVGPARQARHYRRARQLAAADAVRVADRAATAVDDAPLPTYLWGAHGESWLEVDGSTLIRRCSVDWEITGHLALPPGYRVVGRPQLSPDRRRWAVVSGCANACDLRLWDGERVAVPLAGGPFDTIAVREWSADGRWLLADLRAGITHTTAGLWLLDAATGGGGPLAIDGAAVRSTALSPSGDFVAVCAELPAPTAGRAPRLPTRVADVYACRDRSRLLRESRQGQARPGDDVACPVWSPDESRLFVGHAVVYFDLPSSWRGADPAPARPQSSRAKTSASAA